MFLFFFFFFNKMQVQHTAAELDAAASARGLREARAARTATLETIGRAARMTDVSESQGRGVPSATRPKVGE